jgi:cation:H+ antiporter
MVRDLLLVAVGLVALTIAADRLVSAAARLARTWGLSPVLIGAVLIGMGTSLPEMLVSGLAAARPGGLDLAVSNVVGSNLANLSLVLGIAALISPLAGGTPVIRREGLVMLAGSAVLAALAWNGSLTLTEGAVLTAGMVLALLVIARWALTGADPEVTREVEELLGDAPVVPRREVLVGSLSLLVTLAGARLLVAGAEGLARDLGVSEAVIGMTLVAVGTSLPEIATAVAAARRRESDLVLGNVVGSNLFNALAVGGVSALLGAGAIAADLRPSLATMLGVTLLAALLIVTRDRLVRWEGAALVVAYPGLMVAALA